MINSDPTVCNGSFIQRDLILKARASIQQGINNNSPRAKNGHRSEMSIDPVGNDKISNSVLNAKTNPVPNRAADLSFFFWMRCTLTNEIQASAGTRANFKKGQ